MFFWIMCFAFIIITFLLKNCIKLKEHDYYYLIGFVIIIVFLLTIFRPLSLPDINVYISMFKHLNANEKFYTGFNVFLKKEYSSGVEYGFVFLMQAIKKLVTENARIFLMIITVIEIFCINKFSKKMFKDVRDRYHFYFYLIPYFGFMYLFVTIRSGLAIFIALNAFALTKIINEDKNDMSIFKIILAVLLYVLAFSFHRMVIIFAIIEAIYYFMPQFKKSIYWGIWLVCAVLLIASKVSIFQYIQNQMLSITKNNIILRGYLQYFNFDIMSVSTKVGMRSIYFWAIGFFLIKCLPNEMEQNYCKYLNMYMVGLILMNVLSFIPGFFRIIDIIFMFLPILLTYANKVYNQNKKSPLFVLFELCYVICGVIIIIRL